MMKQTGFKSQQRAILWLCSGCLLWQVLLSGSSDGRLPVVLADQYYQRYKSYPPYCSDPSEMNTRAIPPLPKDQNTTTYKSRLQRVTAVIRHGARTPIHTKNCWKGHWNEPDGIWDCELTTMLSTRPIGETPNSETDSGQFLVEKIYDAFAGERPPVPYRNIMNGTCQDGQLIQQGYDQQIRNGQFLRDAYVFDDSAGEGVTDAKGDPRLRLFTTSALLDNGIENLNNRFLYGILRYRSDDDQRTLASGQVLLGAMFGPEAVAYRKAHNGKIPIVEHHTGDHENDIMSLHRGEHKCPKQKELMKRALASEEFTAFYHSEESKTMRQLIDDHLEPEGVLFGGTDCMMTSICTDRSIPDVIRDYGNATKSAKDDAYTSKYGPNRFERLRDYVVQNKTFVSRFNDSELSKMDMGPLWAEMMDTDETFALFSGHDSTIFPLMTSLGERVWNATDFPHYASMMLIEFHDVIDKATGAPPSEFPSGKAFRLVYNGEVLTWLMDGCPEFSQLCDVSVFEGRVKPFATRQHHGCGIEEGGDTDDETDKATAALSQPLSLSFLIYSMVASFVLSSLVTFFIMQCCRWRPRRKHRDESQLVSSGREESFMDEPDIVIS
eukprot:CAMPEP_0116123460 /NCGR_PEP_ID=MMETSP0329-20121206/4763_1 /TAXON_ID=697910 /ORGANISM="Pseudo-nitzschia arenysensis, Strain B593" /LENGTH=607 /DNA_ID=CAMNT_0003617383 /DNA_START=116 /DNA_END=1939 /DNA_ORIENTATION=-